MWRRRLAVLWLLLANVAGLEFYYEYPGPEKMEEEKIDLINDDSSANEDSIDALLLKLIKSINRKDTPFSRPNPTTKGDRLIILLKKIGAKEIKSKRLPDLLHVNMTTDVPHRRWKAKKGKGGYHMGCYFKLCTFRTRFLL